MTFEESTQKNPATLLETNQLFNPERHIAPTVAHQLNNILTIVQGYTDRLLLRHSQNPALMPDLKLISEAARRAAIVIRNAKPPNASEAFRQGSRPPQPQIIG